jgi:hypothetical protein
MKSKSSPFRVAPTYSVTQYALDNNIGHTIAKRVLEQMANSGIATRLPSDNGQGYSYRLPPPLLLWHDPFCFTERKYDPVDDINAWMRGAQLT